MPPRKKDTQAKNSQHRKVESLLPPPEFDYLKSPFPEHQGFPTLPSHFPTLRTLGQIFRLFFDSQVLNTIVNNTNAYAEGKMLVLGRNIQTSSSSAQPWAVLTTP